MSRKSIAMNTTKRSPRKTKILRELFQGELESFLELPAEERNHPENQRDYADIYELAKELDALPGKTALFRDGQISNRNRFPETLSATAEEIERAERPTDPAAVRKHREFMIKQAEETIRRLRKIDSTL